MERSCFLSGGQGDSLFFSGPRFAQAIAAFSYGTRGLEGLPQQLLSDMNLKREMDGNPFVIILMNCLKFLLFIYWIKYPMGFMLDILYR